MEREADVCDKFLAAVPDGWTPYAETCGWDILLVGPSGEQVGIQAKVRAGFHVMLQALPNRHASAGSRGPDWRAVLVPAVPACFAEVCHRLRLVLFVGAWTLSPDQMPGDLRWHADTERRLRLPEFVPDVRAGVSGPIQLTDWKIRALRVMAELVRHGKVTKADFKAHDVDRRLWTKGRYPALVPSAPGEWVLNPRRGDGREWSRLPHEQHPDVFREILAENWWAS